MTNNCNMFQSAQFVETERIEYNPNRLLGLDVFVFYKFITHIGLVPKYIDLWVMYLYII